MGNAFLSIEARSRFPLLKSVLAHFRCKRMGVHLLRTGG
jgi:hypothetical protein